MLVTPHPAATGGSGLSIIHLTGDAAQLESVLERIGAGAIDHARPVLRTIAAIDRAVVVRWSPTCIQIMPHGGEAVVSGILDALRRAGCAIDDFSLPLLGRTGLQPVSTPSTASDTRALYPEAHDDIEALALFTLACAASPLAAETLMRQAPLWRDPRARECTPEEARSLARLLTPPTVVLIGPPNVGKSTLTNAMARRRVSIVADDPGTTRDHVGVTLDLAGLCIRWIDAPGIRGTSDDIELAAQTIARRVAATADLILLCGDAQLGFVPDAAFTPAGAATLRIGLRADRGLIAGCDVATSAMQSQGLIELADAVRETLVPAAALRANARWRFHAGLPSHPQE
jgi:hypothetical protein